MVVERINEKSFYYTYPFSKGYYENFDAITYTLACMFRTHDSEIELDFENKEYSYED